MKRQTSIGTCLAVVLASVCAVSGAADRPVRKPVRGRPPAVREKPGDQLTAMQQGMRLQRQFVELMKDPLLAAQLAITRIKDIAVKDKKPEMAIRALGHIAESTDQPAVKRSALFAISEVHARTGNTEQALRALAGLCQVAPGPRGPAARERAGRRPARPSARAGGEKRDDRGASEMRRPTDERREFARRLLRGFLARRRQQLGAGREGAAPEAPRPGMQRRPGAAGPQGQGPRGWMQRRHAAPGGRPQAPGPGMQRRQARPGGARREPAPRTHEPEGRRRERSDQPKTRAEPLRQQRRFPARGEEAERKDTRLRELMEQLERRNKELHERGGQIERRFDDLRRLADQLREPERDAERPRGRRR